MRVRIPQKKAILKPISLISYVHSSTVKIMHVDSTCMNQTPWRPFLFFVVLLLWKRLLWNARILCMAADPQDSFAGRWNFYIPIDYWRELDFNWPYLSTILNSIKRFENLLTVWSTPNSNLIRQIANVILSSRFYAKNTQKQYYWKLVQRKVREMGDGLFFIRISFLRPYFAIHFSHYYILI